MWMYNLENVKIFIYRFDCYSEEIICCCLEAETRASKD